MTVLGMRESVKYKYKYQDAPTYELCVGRAGSMFENLIEIKINERNDKVDVAMAWGPKAKSVQKKP